MITLTPINIVQGAADLLWSPVLRKFPTLQVRALGGRHRLDALLPRAHRLRLPQHRFWTDQDFGDKLPSEVFREHVVLCFIDDRGRRREAPRHRRRQHHLGVRLPALRLDVAASPGDPGRADARAFPTTRSTRSPTRTRCGSSATTRSGTSPRPAGHGGRAACPGERRGPEPAKPRGSEAERRWRHRHGRPGREAARDHVHDVRVSVRPRR